MSFEEPDPGVLEHAKRELQRLVIEIERLAKSPIEARDFFRLAAKLLQQTIHAAGVAIWRKQGTYYSLIGEADFAAVLQFENEKQQERHDYLLSFVASAERPIIYGAESGPLTDERTESQNLSSFMLIACPIRLEGTALGVLELFLDPQLRPLAYAGYQRLGMKAADEIANFHRNRRYRQFAMQEEVWNELDTFIRVVHGGLSSAETSYVIANSGRKLIGCERVSVAVKRGSHCRIEAVSGQDVVDRKSNLVRRMAKLSDEVLRYGERFVYEGIIEASWPMALAKAMDAYLKESHSRVLIAMPLVDDRARSTSRRSSRAVLIAEVITDDAIPNELAGKLEVVARHGALGLYNSLELEKIFLLPL